MTAYRPTRDPRFAYAQDAIDAIEQANCVRGCRFAVDATPEWPGGTCDLLALVSVGDGQPIPELDDRGEGIHCLRRQEAS